MSNCKDCYHRKVCINGANYKTAENCKQYKPESLIVELPCRVGDDVWVHKILQDGKYTIVIEEDKVRQFIVTPIEVLAIISYSHALSCDDFGKTIFLTREDAERALKERANNV